MCWKFAHYVMSVMSKSPQVIQHEIPTYLGTTAISKNFLAMFTRMTKHLRPNFIFRGTVPITFQACRQAFPKADNTWKFRSYLYRIVPLTSEKSCFLICPCTRKPLSYIHPSSLFPSTVTSFDPNSLSSSVANLLIIITFQSANSLTVGLGRETQSSFKKWE
jgi:hypothetical protein